jgi:WD40 repeat protein
VQFSPDGKTLAAVSMPDGAVHLWEIATGKRLALAEGPKCLFSSLAFAPDGRVLACGIDGQTIALWEVTSDRLLSPATGHRQPVTSLVFAKGGKELITAGSDSMVCWWDPDRGQLLGDLLVTDDVSMRVRVMRGTGGPLVLSPDGKYVAGANEYGGSSMRLWEMATGKALCDFENVGAGRWPTIAVFSPQTARGSPRSEWTRQSTSGMSLRGRNFSL